MQEVLYAKHGELTASSWASQIRRRPQFVILHGRKHRTEKSLRLHAELMRQTAPNGNVHFEQSALVLHTPRVLLRLHFRGGGDEQRCAAKCWASNTSSRQLDLGNDVTFGIDANNFPGAMERNPQTPFLILGMAIRYATRIRASKEVHAGVPRDGAGREIVGIFPHLTSR